MSTHQSIVDQIAHIKPGKILFPADFRGLGTDSAIKMSLSRIASTGGLNRLSHGIYMKPKRNRKSQVAIPSLEEIALAISVRENIRIKPSGKYALYMLGLEKSKPSDLTFVTDGEPRKIMVGDQYITFKSTTPKKLSMKGRQSSLAIQALEEVGKENINDDLLKKIEAVLKQENTHFLNEDVKKAPAWIYNLLIKLTQIKHEVTN